MSNERTYWPKCIRTPVATLVPSCSPFPPQFVIRNDDVRHLHTHTQPQQTNKQTNKHVKVNGRVSLSERLCHTCSPAKLKDLLMDVHVKEILRNSSHNEANGVYFFPKRMSQWMSSEMTSRWFRTAMCPKVISSSGVHTRPTGL